MKKIIFLLLVFLQFYLLAAALYHTWKHANEPFAIITLIALLGSVMSIEALLTFTGLQEYLLRKET